MDSHSDALSIRCHIRRINDETSSTSDNPIIDYGDDEGHNVICKMYPGAVTSNWNLWDGVTSSEPNSVMQGDDDFEKEAKLSFCSLPMPMSILPNRSTSASRSRGGGGGGSRIRRRSVDLLNPNQITTTSRRIPMNIRAESPGPRRRISPLNGRKSRGSTPSRDCSDAAAACFVVRELEKKNREELRFEGFDVVHSDLISVQKDFMSSRNAGIGAIVIQTRSHATLEICPHSKHGRDMLVAFLKTYLPKDRVRDTLLQFKRQLHCVSSEDLSFDMQMFEASAVESRFANESVWDKMRRKSAIFSLHMQELCFMPCCETTVTEENDYVYKDSSLADKDVTDSTTVNTTIESVLTEMELDAVKEENESQGPGPESIRIITCTSVEEREVSHIENDSN